ncbi:hypothetical protein C8J56DRAFT_971940 [Mycena floridula]|nr:hypothetical protein C8J56DRAFT_971940 [Mycena floridula]
MPDTSFTITKAEIVGLCLESIGYGIFLITFFPCIKVLVWDSSFRRRKTINWIMLVVACLLFCFATMDVAFGLQHNIVAFVLYTGPGGAAEQFSDISNYVSVMKSVDVFFSVIIGDAMLIYRCWVVYGKSYLVIAFPLLIWMADTACAMVLTWIEATFHSHSLLLAGKFGPFLTSFASLTIVQNVITTALIIWRIWKVDRENAKYRYNTGSTNTGTRRSSRLRNVMRIVIESGLLYTTFAVISFCTYVTNSNAFYVTTDMVDY